MSAWKDMSEADGFWFTLIVVLIMIALFAVLFIASADRFHC